jgi:hypothetical protein
MSSESLTPFNKRLWRAHAYIESGCSLASYDKLQHIKLKNFDAEVGVAWFTRLLRTLPVHHAMRKIEQRVIAPFGVTELSIVIGFWAARSREKN